MILILKYKDMWSTRKPVTPKNFLQSMKRTFYCIRQLLDKAGTKKLSTVKILRKEYAKLLAEKKNLYPEYSNTQQEMRNLQMTKVNVDQLMGYDEKEQEQKRKKIAEQTSKDPR